MIHSIGKLSPETEQVFRRLWISVDGGIVCQVKLLSILLALLSGIAVTLCTSPFAAPSDNSSVPRIDFLPSEEQLATGPFADPSGLRWVTDLFADQGTKARERLREDRDDYHSRTRDYQW